MFHCEPQCNEVLLAALMVTADEFKLSLTKNTTCLAKLHNFSATKEDCGITCPEDLYDGHPWAWLGIVLS